MKKKAVICLSLISGLFIVLLVSLSIIFGGLYNVGATDDHTQPIEWILRTTMENSVRNHAADITVPDTLDLMDPGFPGSFTGITVQPTGPATALPGIAVARHLQKLMMNILSLA